MLYLCVLRVYVCYGCMCVISLLSFKPGFKVIFTWFEHARIACPLGSVSVIHLCYHNSLPHIFTTVLPKNLLSITNLWTLVLIHLGLSCLGFTDLVFFFFFPQELKDISYPINCFINTVIGSICLNNSMSLLHLVPYSLYFACDISVLSQVSIHFGNRSFSFSCGPVLWVLITFLFQNQNSRVYLSDVGSHSNKLRAFLASGQELGS